MNATILKQTRLWTIVAAIVLAVIFAIVISPGFGIGVFVSALWAVVGFWALAGIIRHALLPPGSKRNRRAILGWALLKIAVYALAIWALFAEPFPPVSYLVGFSLLLVVLVTVGLVALPRGANQPVQRGDNG